MPISVNLFLDIVVTSKNLQIIMVTMRLLILVALVHSLSAKTFNVVSDYGAKGDGKTDNSASFLKAWKDACSSGPCVCSNMGVQIDGRLIPRTESEGYGTSDYWLKFERVKGMTFSGGYLDGMGSALWSCKAGKRKCPYGTRTMIFHKVSDVLVTGITSIDSELFHIVIDGCENVRVDRVKIVAPDESPNTDGIHVEESKGVAITNSNIGTGDDCISIGKGTQNLWIEAINCGPGHGISIGSLGQEAVEPGVQNVTVKNVVLTGTQNGLRIKSWARKSTGYVSTVLFDGASVNYPIIIDQDYCPDRINCPGQTSGVKISQITYSNVRGTSATEVAVLFKCSASNWCQGMKMADVQLSYKGRPSTATCQNAMGSAGGAMVPQSCLQLPST
ncbi:unnamed protein product [Victoria cruziana]